MPAGIPWHRAHAQDSEPLGPGRPVRLRFELMPTSWIFKAGHRIGLEVSSSNFPRLDRNPNTGGVIAETAAADCEPAVQTIFHTADYPSRVTLPLVPQTP